MKTYPVGVLQNYNIEGMGPPKYGPVLQEMWRSFGPEADAEAGLGMILGVMERAQMFPAEALGGMYAQYRYVDPASDIHCRLAAGETRDAGGRLYILEYPTDIFDRDTTPLPFIDQYTAGQPHVLKVRRVAGLLGELYWAAA